MRVTIGLYFAPYVFPLTSNRFNDPVQDLTSLTCGGVCKMLRTLLKGYERPMIWFTSLLPYSGGHRARPASR
jgi:hypothetical protein